MRITIKDVAKQARVSPATVSLVLNNAPGVSAMTREKVLRVIAEIDYKPDALARRFSSGRTEAIALIMPPEIISLYDPYFMSLIRGAIEAARDRGFRMLLELADARFMEQRIWEDLFRKKYVDGLVIATPFLDQEYLSEIPRAGFQAILVNGDRSDIPELDYVGYDDVRCGFEATYYLIGLGHRRIAHFAGPTNQASALKRFEGFRQALERARIPFRPEDIYPGDYMSEMAAAAMRRMLSRPTEDRPTAIFAANDTTALGAMEVAKSAGLAVPEHISIIGVDDTGAAALAQPGLTTMRQDIHALTYRAVCRFLRKLEERAPERIHERSPMTLIERGSCAPPEGRR
ncbi:MAG: LacI family DNA-binding transcriptional regulator [Capsulimonadales bacterium]|nr:LacI family DNA-binding transcriptional regulator [Capsulimonadales bacterium]